DEFPGFEESLGKFWPRERRRASEGPGATRGRLLLSQSLVGRARLLGDAVLSNCDSDLRSRLDFQTDPSDATERICRAWLCDRSWAAPVHQTHRKRVP